MSIFPVLVAVSMLIVLGAGVAFFWAVDNDQFEDLEGPAYQPMMDDPPALPASPAVAGTPRPAR